MADKKNNRRNNRNNNDDDFNPKFKKRKKVCPLCKDKNLVLDYKNPEQLKKFINERGTGACAKHQRDITLEVKRCRQIAMLPYTQE